MKLDSIIHRIKTDYGRLFNESTLPTIRILFSKKMSETVLTKLEISVEENKRNIFVKEYRPSTRFKGQVIQRLKREYNTLKDLNEKWKDETHIPVVKPIGCYQDLTVLLTEEVKGDPLHQRIKRGASWFPIGQEISKLKEYCFQTGHWLSSLQEVSRTIEMVPYDKGKTIEEVCELVKVEENESFLPRSLCKRILQFLDKSRPNITDRIPVTGMHSDFIPSNILASKANIVMLDFECFRSGPIYRDVITFIQALDNYLINPFIDKKIIGSLKDEFLRGYGNPIRREDLPLVRILEIRETLGQLPDWVTRKGLDLIRGWASWRGRRHLERRLNRLLQNTGPVGGEYWICDVAWKVNS